MPQPKVNIAGSDGSLVEVTDGKLEVELGTSPTIDIGDVEITGHGTAGHFAQQIDDSNTQLSSSGAIKHADIMANISNSGIIYIGVTGVGATTGIALYPGDVYSVDIKETNLLYALAVVDNDDINVVWYK
tara:strand:+ start:223 stop:612 length:390 start_codon:yes stop_codon:yes gene_type:complete